MPTKHLFVTEKLSVTGFTSFGFAQNMIPDSKYRNEIIIGFDKC